MYIIHSLRLRNICVGYVCVRVWVGACARTRVHQLDSAAKRVPALTKADGGHKSACVNSKKQYLLWKHSQNPYYYPIQNMTPKIYKKLIQLRLRKHALSITLYSKTP